MVVKKFEAKTMREALLMVKDQLGPEAIIVNAKGMRENFGLKGERSVEVTAAVSEGNYRQMKLVEQKMNKESLEKFKRIKAKEQKKYIDKSFSSHKNEELIKPITEMRYINIIDSEDGGSLETPAAQAIRQQKESEVSPLQAAKNRIRSAAREAKQSFSDLSSGASTNIRVSDNLPSAVAQNIPLAAKTHISSYEQGVESVASLHREIKQLKQLLQNFQQVPQSFVGNQYPGAEYGIPYSLSFMYKKLVRSGVSEQSSVEFMKRVQSVFDPITITKKKYLIDAWIVREMMNELKIVNFSGTNKFQYQVFVGNSGQGKTASMIKLSSNLAINQQKKIVIATTDIFKVGACEQLQIFAKILNVPFVIIRSAQDWSLLQQNYSHFDHIMVDFPSLGLKEQMESHWIKSMLPSGASGRQIHYVQSVLTKDVDAFEVADRYKEIHFDDVIFTHIDESAQHGIIYNFQKKYQVPLHSFGIGPKIPEDMELATKERVVDLIFKLTSSN